MSHDSGSIGEVAAQSHLLMLRNLLTSIDRLIREQDVNRIIRLVAEIVPALGGFRSEGLFLEGRIDRFGSSGSRLPRTVRSRLANIVAPSGERIALVGRPWGWAFPLVGPSGRIGHLLVSAPADPDLDEVFFVALLAQQVGVAIANASLHLRELTQADELRDAIDALEQNIAIHQRLTNVAVSGGGQIGIAQALHDLTNRAAVIEDRHGNLVAWAGPGRPDSYPREAAAQRARSLRRAMLAGGPIRIGGRLLSIANPYVDILGVVALIDPENTASESDRQALEYATTVLALELTRLHNAAQDDLRMRAELVMELVTGRRGPEVHARAQSLDYDLGRPHRVVIIEVDPVVGDSNVVANALRRVTWQVGVGSLFAVQQGRVIIVSDHDVAWDSFRDAVAAELQSRRCRLGVGRRADSPEDIPHSYKEAEHALNLQKKTNAPRLVTVFDDLGIYQLLIDSADPSAMEDFVHRWLGRLMDYDAQHGSQLVMTLGTYLESGGRYDQTAESLFVHRNTLKYRLRRIREVSDLNLGTPETNFNLQLATRALRALQVLRDG